MLGRLVFCNTQSILGKIAMKQTWIIHNNIENQWNVHGKLSHGFFMGHKIPMTVAILYLSYESVNSQPRKTHYFFLYCCEIQVWWAIRRYFVAPDFQYCCENLVPWTIHKCFMAPEFPYWCENPMVWWTVHRYFIAPEFLYCAIERLQLTSRP